MLNHRLRATTRVLLALTAVTGLLAGCITNYDPRGDPPATPTLPAPSNATPAASASTGGAIRVALANATGNAVMIEVSDASGTLLGAASGAPGDGASVEAYTLAVANQGPNTLRLTWLGGPCDGTMSLAIDAARSQLLLVQPECPGDAIATDRILDLQFAAPVTADQFEAFLQDGVDTPA